MMLTKKINIVSYRQTVIGFPDQKIKANHAKALVGLNAFKSQP